ncbi:MAG: HDIG domain-containing protein, partial [Synergistetes bacterium]|nr:HDIG domain-containing protein [Synergistota bacterium]MDW8191813.1 HDIG domain-containing protein [Synergistota bacterium]
MGREKGNGNSSSKAGVLKFLKEKLTIALIFGGIGAAILLMLSWDWVSTLRFSVRIGEKAPYDIVAYKDVEVIDEEETKRLRERAAARIKGVFVKDDNIAKGALGRIEEKLLSIELSIPKARELILNVLKEEYDKGINQENLIGTVETVLGFAEEAGLKSEEVSKLKEILLGELKPNVVLDVAETEKQKQLVMMGIRPIVMKVHRGEVVVRKGEPLKREHILILEALGFSKEKVLLRLVGLGVISSFIAWLIFLYIREWYYSKLKSTGLLLFLLFSIITLFLSAKVLIPLSPALIPIGIIPLSYSILICPRFAIFATWILAFAVSLFRGAGFIPLTLGVFGGTFAVRELKKIRQRGTLIRAGLLMGVINVLALTSVGLFINLPVRNLLINALLGFLNGIGSSIIVAGSLPYLESFFGLLSPLKLLELADPSHPLLKRLQVEAAGTYHHSLLVANLAEAAAEEIGADALLARVGSYYHDIGKLKRPHLFVENQMDKENYHAKIKPSLSMLVIVSHVKDSVELAREYKLPQAVIDIIVQHHGTTVVSYFY